MLSKIWYCEVCDREYRLVGKTQHLKMVLDNKNFINRLLELDHLKPEDESIETLLCLMLNFFIETILNNSKMGSAFKNT